jgi:SAM-dependent methyltransferase
MDHRFMRRVQRYGWDRAAAHYDRSWTAALAPATQALMQRAALRPGEDVLDVACGTGELTRAALGAVGSRGSVVGTDLSAAMVAAAERRAPAARFLRADAADLDAVLPAAGFDVVLCGLGLMYMPDPDAALAAMARRLRPGGRIVLSVWGDRRDCGWAAIFPLVDAHVQSEVCPLFFLPGVGATLERMMQRGGLQPTGSERLSVTLPFADDDTACEAAFEGGPVALAYSRFDAATRSELRAQYLQTIAPWREGAGYRIPGAFLIGSGRRP